jgi:hypothetical protein
LLEGKSTKRGRSQATQACGTNIAVGRIAESIRASAENFAFRQQLHIDFKSDDRFVFGSTSGAIA